MNYLTDLDDLAHTLHAHARTKGFYEPLEHMDDKDHIVFQLKQLAMIHSEVTEVLEAMRKSQGGDKVTEELADILIRVLDFWAYLNETGYTLKKLSVALNEKIAENQSRSHMHGVLG
jgi:NTP pyrophosphatase (non-canonical NTP hydrolase)